MQATVQAELVTLNAERTLLEKQRDDLLQQLKELNRCLELNAVKISNLSPVNTIPDDLLRLIFEVAYRHVEYDTQNPSRCTNDSPLTATHVSRRWRHVAGTLPTLWTCIHGDFHTDAIALFLQRTHGLPLQFILEANTRRPIEAARLLQHNAARWRSLHLNAVLTSSDEFMDAVRKLDFPLLERMRFHTRDAGALPVSMSSGPTFPKLKHLVMDGMYFDWHPPQLQNLRTLYLGFLRINSQDIKDISTVAPNLIELTVRATNPSLLDEFGQPHISLFPMLQKLTIILAFWEDTLLQIDAPRLHTLICDRAQIRLSIHPATEVFPEGGDFRTFPSLTHLRLDRCIMKTQAADADDMADSFHLFQRAPNLRSLDLIDCNTSNMSRILRWLRDSTAATQRGVLLPHLETVTLKNVQPADFAAVTEFVHERSRFEPPLRGVRLGAETVQAMGPELVQTLSQFVTVSTVVGSDLR